MFILYLQSHFFYFYSPFFLFVQCSSSIQSYLFLLYFGMIPSRIAFFYSPFLLFVQCHPPFAIPFYLLYLGVPPFNVHPPFEFSCKYYYILAWLRSMFILHLHSPKHRRRLYITFMCSACVNEIYTSLNESFMVLNRLT